MKADQGKSFRRDLLSWYDAHARDLPWRVSPQARAGGVVPDPYRVWLSEIMLQQTVVAAVKSYFNHFVTTWPTVHDLADADDAQVMAAWAGLGYYARARNLLACARQVAASGGVFPDTQEALQKLPGIGPYTSAALAAIAFDKAANVVDGNVERVMARLFAVTVPLPKSKAILVDHAASFIDDERPSARHGDYAQALMDLGATVCTPKSPKCGVCPVFKYCAAQKAGIAASLPMKEAKAPKPTRLGIAYVLRRADGATLLEKRAEKGLLGGMMGFPGSDWAETAPAPKPPATADWVAMPTPVKHTFTHFHLRLEVMTAVVSTDCTPDVGQWVPADQFNAKNLPTVMRKVFHASQTGSKT